MTFAQCALVTLSECRRHLLPNLAAIASDDGHQPEHVHQARVALRRLRSAIRLFEYAPLFGLDAKAQALARALGECRKRDVLVESVAPQLSKAGAPTTEMAALSPVSDARSVARQRDSQALLLELIKRELELDLALPSATEAAAPQLIARLSDWHRKVRREARQFEALDDERRHQLRRRMKRLRYGTEFCRSLCSDKRYRRLLGSLSLAQEALGRYNDLVEALAGYRAQADQDPRAWFAVGWLTAEIQAQLLRCQVALATPRRCEAPWKVDRP